MNIVDNIIANDSVQNHLVYDTSIKGRRKNNEDKHIILLNKEGQNEKYNNIDLFGIYDGHGGKAVSSFLVNNLPLYFTSKKTQYPLSKTYIYKVHKMLQQKLEIDNPLAAKNSGSTSLMVMLYKNSSKNNSMFMNIINVGDSRCVLCKDNIAIALTKDHKPNWPEEKIRIEDLGGTIYNDGSDWRIHDLSVSRAFGDVDATPYVTCIPDIYHYKIDKNCKFFVIACDGIWDVLTNQEVVNFVLTYCFDTTTKVRINKHLNIAKRLTEYAYKKGSGDNLTVIVVFFDH